VRKVGYRWLVGVLACVACESQLSLGVAPDASSTTAPDAGIVLPPGKLFELLDDTEADEPNLVTPVGLASWELATADGAAAAMPQREFAAPDLPRDDSTRAQHIRVATPGTIDARFDMHGPQFSTGKAPYPDLSAYAAVAFWARAPAATSTSTSIIVALDDGHAPGTSYAATRDSANAWFEHPVTLSSEWRRHILLFDDFRRPNDPDALPSTKWVWSIHFLGGLDGGGAELWIDDLALLCRGTCPVPANDVHPTPGPGMDEQSLHWVVGQGITADTTCATIAPLSMAPLSDVPADPVEKLVLRVRVPVDPPPAVAAWDWLVTDLASGANLNVTVIDATGATVAVPINAAGSYLVLAHTHYPNVAVCGLATDLEAH
jgi:hypothetical protein